MLFSYLLLHEGPLFEMNHSIQMVWNVAEFKGVEYWWSDSHITVLSKVLDFYNSNIFICVLWLKTMQRVRNVDHSRCYVCIQHSEQSLLYALKIHQSFCYLQQKWMVLKEDIILRILRSWAGRSGNCKQQGPYCYFYKTVTSGERVQNAVHFLIIVHCRIAFIPSVFSCVTHPRKRDKYQW